MTTDQATLHLEGELDIATAPRFRTEVGALLGTGCRRLVVDLEKATFVDSCGLGALVWAAHRLHAAGGALVATNPNAQISKTLQITGLERLLSLA